MALLISPVIATRRRRYRDLISPASLFDTTDPTAPRSEVPASPHAHLPHVDSGGAVDAADPSAPVLLPKLRAECGRRGAQ